MSDACESRQLARAAWNSGNLAETHRHDNDARHVELARWDRGECCGFKCGAKVATGMRNCYSGFIQAKRLHLMRAWGIPDHLIEALQPNCEHDHGNAEMMVDPETHQPHTAHTLNRVPVMLVGGAEPGRNASWRLHDGKLADVAPTLLELLGLSQPREMTGESLITPDGRAAH